MGELVSAVDRFFAKDGLLVSHYPGKNFRPGQHTMALEVARSVEDGTTLVIEAGTGIGKTFAYLTPLLLGRGRAIVATATKALQDQLLLQDIPQLQAMLQTSVKVVALKGRSSYLCVQRLERAMQNEEVLREAPMNLWARLHTWSRTSTVGDMAEFEDLDDNSALLPAITSTRDNCLGAECPQLGRCHVNRARREALSAELVVVNHHLFFADLQVRESGVAELLPNALSVVFDEAHQLNDIGVQFLGQHLAAVQFDTFVRDARRTLTQYASGWFPWGEQLERCEVQLSIVGELAAGLQRKSPWNGMAPEGFNQALWIRCIATLLQDFSVLLDGIRAVVEAAVELRSLSQRGERLMVLLQMFAGNSESERLRWLEPGRSWRMVASPLDIAKSMKEHFGSDMARSRKAWVFTSATLGVDAQLSWFTRSCGLHDPKIVRLPSPFDYERQSALYIPADFPTPGEAAHSEEVAKLVAQAVIVLEGRTLVLATTLKAMHLISRAMAKALDESQIEVLVQGQAPKLALLARFRKSGRDGFLPSVLVASASYWEGIDIPGDALQLVVIDKLPFTPPDDPVQQARALKIENEGGNAFKELHLTQAAVALRQGAGRLIRSETDRGLLMVCDRRLISASYGKKLLAALPPMRRLHTQEAFLQALRELPEFPPGGVFDLPAMGEKF